MRDCKVSFDSDTYPYERVMTGYNRFVGAEQIPYKILIYLMDMADKNGYVPKDDNERARVRLAKYLWYDSENPLAQPLPTDEQKRSLLYDGNDAVLDKQQLATTHPKGYRLYAQKYWTQSELEAKVLLKCYTGRVLPTSPYKASIGLTFEIIINCAMDTTTRTTAYSKIYAMECALIEALHGVNIAGVGTVEFNRYSHPEAGSRAYADEGTHISRVINMSIDWQESREDAF